MRLLVTGGCGFIGSNFLHHWVERQPTDELVNLDALTYAGNPANVADLRKRRHYKFIKGDICNPKQVQRALRNVDAVVNFAAESHVDRSIADAAPFLRTNVQGTATLLDEARRADVNRFHHVSTDEVFGDLPLTGKERFSETSPYRPQSPYAASKAASDHLVRAWGHTYGLPYTITNGSNNFGPYQHPEKAIPRFITNLLRGKDIELYGNGRNVRDWLHVEDYAHAIALVLLRGTPGETYCVGGGTQLDNRTLAKKIAAAFGHRSDVIRYVKDRPGHDRRYAIDARKISQELGWTPSRKFDTALNETIAWYRSHPSWWRPLVR